MTLPPPLPERWGVTNPVPHRAGEWTFHRCPRCGSRSERDGDRFVIINHDGPLRGWCRSCRFFEFADALAQKNGHYIPPVMEAWEREAGVLDDVKKLREGLYDSGVWLAAHADVDKSAWAEAFFGNNLEMRPLSEYLIERYTLGTLTYRGRYKREPFSSLALSIPYWGTSGQLLSIQYRLLQPPARNERYRFESGLGAPPFLTSQQKQNDSVVVIEGAKKAMVASLYMEHAYDLVGVPSKHLSPDIAHFLAKRWRRVYLMLDPDAFDEEGDGENRESAVDRGTNMLLEAGTTVGVVSVPDKVDDLVTYYGWQGDDLLSAVDMARVYKQRSA